jgi:hypothetical protein
VSRFSGENVGASTSHNPVALMASKGIALPYLYLSGLQRNLIEGFTVYTEIPYKREYKEKRPIFPTIKTR